MATESATLRPYVPGIADMPERKRARAKGVERLSAAGPRSRRLRLDEHGDGVAAPFIEVQIRNLTHVVRASIPRDAGAIEIAHTLREMVFERLHLFWRVQRGDYPPGRRIPVPTLRAWIVTEPAMAAGDRPADLEAGLGEAGDVIAAIKALCLPEADEPDLQAAEHLWADYRFSDVIRVCRREVIALTERCRSPQCFDPREP